MNLFNSPWFWNVVGVILVAAALIPVGILLFWILRISVLFWDSWWKGESHAMEESEGTARLEQLDSLPIQIARTRALKLIKDPRRFVTSLNPDPSRRELGALAPLMREFFTTYETVATPAGEASISLLCFRHIRDPAGYFEIGGDEDVRYVVKPGEERIHGEHDGKLETYAQTIYHLVIYIDEMLHGTD